MTVTRTFLLQDRNQEWRKVVTEDTFERKAVHCLPFTLRIMAHVIVEVHDDTSYEVLKDRRRDHRNNSPVPTDWRSARTLSSEDWHRVLHRMEFHYD